MENRYTMIPHTARKSDLKTNDTAQRLLSAARALVQSRGYNAFSYKDLQEAVGIRTASIHYHFPTKVDLGIALMDQYKSELNQALSEIDRKKRTNKSKLNAFIDLYQKTESNETICLCGSLASDQKTLPEQLQKSVITYLKESEHWLARVIHDGADSGEFVLSSKPKTYAITLLASLQGGLILSFASDSQSIISEVQRAFFNSLSVS